MIPNSCARTAAPGMVLVLLSNENPDNMEGTQGGLCRLEEKQVPQGSLGTQPVLIHGGLCKNLWSLPKK